MSPPTHTNTHTHTHTYPPSWLVDIWGRRRVSIKLLSLPSFSPRHLLYVSPARTHERRSAPLLAGHSPLLRSRRQRQQLPSPAPAPPLAQTTALNGRRRRQTPLRGDVSSSRLLSLSPRCTHARSCPRRRFAIWRRRRRAPQSKSLPVLCLTRKDLTFFFLLP